ncbi:MAG: hypothetical protein M1822_004164 [Bathelium mastoideum]|nr:MAG: hypothetical protein M1822_004164 [Bathelium mastoideum]
MVSAAPPSPPEKGFGSTLLGVLTTPLVDLMHLTIRHIYGLKAEEVRHLPVRALNLPSYGNWTEDGWNLHVHGNIFHQPNATKKTLNAWARRFMVFTTHVEKLPPHEQDLARNATAEILTLPVSQDAPYWMDVTDTTGDHREVQLPYTINTGDFDGWLQLGDMSQLHPGNDSATPLQRVTLGVKKAQDANSTGFLVPPHGISVISDIDDVLRVTQIWRFIRTLKSAFSQEFLPWEGMPGSYHPSVAMHNFKISLLKTSTDIFQDMAASNPGMHFHYLTVPPEFLSRKYHAFIRQYYPDGSLDTLPMDLGNAKSVFHGRKFLLDRIFDTFPTRKFILVGDNSNR